MGDYLRRSILLVACSVVALSSVFTMLLPAPNVQAAFEPTNPSASLADTTERWLSYRGMRACLKSGFSNKDTRRSASDINAGKWDPGENARGFGYLGPDMDGANDNDGTVDCDDGNVFVNGAEAFGFTNPVAMLCAMYDKLSSVPGVNNRDNYLKVNGSGGCTKSTEFTFSGADDNSKGTIYQQALTKALDTTGKRPAFRLQDNDEGPMLYLIGKRSLEVFCGNNTSLADGIKDIKNEKGQVIVDVVDSTGNLTHNNKVYDLSGGRDQDSEVADVVYDANRDNENTPKWQNDDNSAHDYHCHEMATLTTKYSSDYSAYIISSYNQQAAKYLKDEFKATKGLSKDVFNQAVDQCVDFTRNYANDNVILQLKSELKGAMDEKERVPKLKECVAALLPAKYDDAINKIDNTTIESPDAEEALGGDDETGTTCDIDGMGWIVCPVMNFMAKINDAALSFLGENFLQISPQFFERDDTRAAWGGFRDIANILFVVIFLFIIYSQMTGAGISNYGVKRMLPKLVVAAILVNASYILCQIAIDLSNIIGANISQFLATQLPTDTDSGTTYSGLGDLSWEKTTLAILAIGATAALAIALLVAIGLPVLLVLAMIVLILIARKAIIILLVVTAPVAFVAYLLPNTEGIFKKWWGLFKAMLLLYPIIGMVFGASVLAATIIADTAGDDILLQLTALAVTALPLFAVPMLLKGALGGLGSVGAKLSGGLNKATGMAGGNAKGAVKRRAENVEARMAGYEGRGGRFVRGVGGFRNRRAFGRKSLETDTARRQQSALSQHVAESGNYNERQQAEARSALLKEYNEEVGREKTTMSDLKHDELMAIVKDKKASAERRAAAAGVIGSRSYRKGHQELLDELGREDHEERGSEALKTIQQQAAYDMKDMPKGMGDGDKSALGEGRFVKPTGVSASGQKRTVSQESMLERLHEGKLSDQAFATLDPDDLKIVEDLKKGGHLTPEAQKSIDDIVDRLRRPENANIYAASKDNARKIHDALHS
ncbi:MAG TPA: hypothetical protein VGE13_00155 [Candidatus Saccharimonadales bacterium]